jgi:hypothetical protein
MPGEDSGRISAPFIRPAGHPCDGGGVDGWCSGAKRDNRMIDEPTSRELMMTIFEYLKMHYQTLSTLMSEVAALRETLGEIGGEKFLEAFGRHRVEQIAKSAAIESVTVRVYDEIIQRLRAK